MAKTIGIDLGTTNSCMAVLEGGEPTVIENAEGGRTTPSVVAFTASGERLVGTVAKRQAVTNPQNTIFSIKRFMGRKEAEVREEESIVPYKVVSGPNGDARVEAGGEQHSPPEISAMILQKLKADAEAYLGEAWTPRSSRCPRTSTTISARRRRTPARSPGWTSSASSTSRPRRRWPTAWTRSPTRRSWCSTSAAARSTCRCWRSATACSRSSRPPATTTSAATTSTRRSSTGWCRGVQEATRASTSRADPMALQRLYEAAEKAKIELSTTQETQINLPFITADSSGPKHLDMRLTRAKLSELTSRAARPRRRAGAPGDGRRQKQGRQGDRPRRARRRHDALAGGAGEGQRADRQGAAPRREPRRGRRRRRGDPGRRAGRRRQGRAAARRHPADPRHRDQGRRDDEADRAQHDDPDPQGRGLLDGGGQPAVGRDPRAAGRARDGSVQQVAGQVPADGHPAGAAGDPADRGRLRHRRQRHPERLGEGSGHGQGAEDRDQGGLRALRRGDQEHGLRRGVPRRGGPPRRASSRRRATTARTPPIRPSVSWPISAIRSTPTPRARIEEAIKEVREVARVRGPGGDQRQGGGAADAPSTRSPRRCTSAPRSRLRPPATERPRTVRARPHPPTRRTWSTPRS